MKNNIPEIQALLIEKNLDALLIKDEKNQRYATGFPFTDGSVLVSQSEAWLVTDSRYIEAAGKAVAGTPIEALLFNEKKKQNEILSELIDKAKIKTLGFEEDCLSYSAYRSYSELLGREMVPAQDIFRTLRAVKNSEELASMRRAQRISEAALHEVLALIRPGMTEREVAAELSYRMLCHGSEGNSFDPIVITGAKTSMPHGVPGDEVIREGDFVTMDFGSLIDGYCSDMTRTVAVGRADDEMKNIYSTVLEAQLAGIRFARAGVPGCDIDAAARGVIEEAGFGEYFGHSFGHSLGLDIHELPNAAPSYKAVMPENAVISAEPGIYIPGRFGVRIEDVLVLKENGNENITAFPKELIILGGS